MSRPIKHGSVDISTILRFVDSADGTPETGVVAATAGLAFNYRREGGLLVSIGSLSDLAALNTAHADGGLKHVGDGYYRLDVPDAAFASGAEGVLIEGAATGMVALAAYHPLVAVDLQDAVRLGLTALPNAVAGANGGLPLGDASARVLLQPTQTGVTIPTVTTLTGHTPQTGDNYARLGAPAGASVSADVAAVKVDTAAILIDTAEIGAAGAGLTAVASAANLATVAGYLDTEIAAIKAKTDNLPATPAATGDIPTLVQINAEVDTALTDIHLDHLLAADYDPASKPGVATALLNELVESNGGVSRFTANALEQGPSGSAATVTVSYSQVKAALAAAVEAGTITLRPGYNSVTLTGLGSLAGRTKLYVTIKKSREQADTAATLQWEESVGLVYLNGAAATASEGTLTVNDATTGSITFTLKSGSGVALAVDTYEYDVKMVTSASNVDEVKAEGKAVVRRTVTRAIT